MKENDTALPSIAIDSETKKIVKVKAAQEDISITAFIRAALHLWSRGDPSVKRIIEEAKKK